MNMKVVPVDKIICVLTNIPTRDGEAIREPVYETYQYKDFEVSGFQTNEAPVRTIIRKLADDGDHERLNLRIVCLCSKEVREKLSVTDGGTALTTIDFFKKNTKAFCETEKAVKDKLNKIDFEIIEYDFLKGLFQPDTIKEVVERITDDRSATVHIDTTGGGRDTSNLITLIVYVLKHAGIEVGFSVFSQYDRLQHNHRVLDVEDQYVLNNLNSAISSFVNFGKADELYGIFKKSRVFGTVVKDMMTFSDNISLCRLKSLNYLIGEKIYKQLDYISGGVGYKSGDLTLSESLFLAMIPTFKAEFIKAKEQNGKYSVELPDIIEWTAKHKLIQQALCFIREDIGNTPLFSKVVSELQSDKLNSFLSGNKSNLSKCEGSEDLIDKTAECLYNNWDIRGDKLFLIIGKDASNMEFKIEPDRDQTEFLLLNQYLSWQRNRASHTDKNTMGTKSAHELKDFYNDYYSKSSEIKLESKPTADQLIAVIRRYLTIYKKIDKKSAVDEAQKRIEKIVSEIAFPSIYCFTEQSFDESCLKTRINDYLNSDGRSGYRKEWIQICDPKDLPKKINGREAQLFFFINSRKEAERIFSGINISNRFSDAAAVTVKGYFVDRFYCIKEIKI